MQKKYQFIWFRQDLRLNDHAAFWHATQTDSCIALVILSPQQWQLHDDAPIKINFYLRQLARLQQDLDALNIPLIIRHVDLWQNIPEHILQLCQQLSVTQIHANIELGVNELKRDQAIQQCLSQHHIDIQFLQDRTLFPVGSIRNQSQRPYQVFSAFKKSCYERLQISLPLLYPKPHPQLPLDTAYLAQCNQLNDPLPEIGKISASQQELWPVGEEYALQCLDNFIEQQVEQYHIQRDLPAHYGTSKLSPYLNIGVLSVRQCLQALFRKQAGHFIIEHLGQQTWLDELLWREFYQHILYDFPHVSKHQSFKQLTREISWREAPEDLYRWQQGQTGIPIVDAGMRQLLQTGWMHNRVRMICAMFLAKNLLIDWRHGERWFMQHLIDGDLAANNGGWQWCASTGTDAVPYFRVFNPVSQSQKFDPEGQYIRQWVPELSHLDAKFIHEPYAHLSANNLTHLYPEPMVDLKSSRIRAIEAFKP